MHAVALRCEHREDIPCIDDPAPRFGWALESATSAARQTAYRLIVADHADDVAAGRGTLWDTGRVESGETVEIVYEGRPLPCASECAWRVRVWDEVER